MRHISPLLDHLQTKQTDSSSRTELYKDLSGLGGGRTPVVCSKDVI